MYSSNYEHDSSKNDSYSDEPATNECADWQVDKCYACGHHTKIELSKRPLLTFIGVHSNRYTHYRNKNKDHFRVHVQLLAVFEALDY
jgi:hypothetical protein